ncbi:uncharacterized protein LOC106629475 isoform X2 [Zonotrichia albicollis]
MVAGRGLPVLAPPDPRAMRGAMSEGGDPRPLFGRGGLPLRLCEGGEGSEEVGSRGGRGGRAATPPRRGSRGKIKIVKQEKNHGGEGRGIRPGMAGRGRGSPALPGAGGGGPGRDGGSAGAERRLPTAPAWRSGGVCAERAKRGRRTARGERIPGKGEERKGNRKRGNSEGTGRLGLGGGASRFLASLPVPCPSPWVSVRCPPPGSPRPARPLAPFSSLRRSHTNKMAAVVPSLSRALGGKRRWRRRPEMSQENTGGGAAAGGVVTPAGGDTAGRGPAALAHTMERGAPAGWGERHRPGRCHETALIQSALAFLRPLPQTPVAPPLKGEGFSLKKKKKKKKKRLLLPAPPHTPLSVGPKVRGVGPGEPGWTLWPPRSAALPRVCCPARWAEALAGRARFSRRRPPSFLPSRPPAPGRFPAAPAGGALLPPVPGRAAPQTWQPGPAAPGQRAKGPGNGARIPRSPRWASGCENHTIAE